MEWLWPAVKIGAGVGVGVPTLVGVHGFFNDVRRREEEKYQMRKKYADDAHEEFIQASRLLNLTERCGKLKQYQHEHLKELASMEPSKTMGCEALVDCVKLLQSAKIGKQLQSLNWG